MLKHLDLFAGIAGFSLGLERTGGFKTVRFVEIDSFCQRVIRKHYPDIPIDSDITKAKFEHGEADIITGGFPCQDISYAGHGAGLAGERSGLYREALRAIRLVRPKYALLENVAALLNRGMGTILRDLAEIGYDAEWHCVPASYAGARQLRDRVWIVASPQCDGLQGWANIAQAWQEKSREEQLAGFLQPHPWPTVSGARDRGTGHGIPDGTHRNKALGNAVDPYVVELLGHAILEAERG